MELWSWTQSTKAPLEKRGKVNVQSGKILLNQFMYASVRHSRYQSRVRACVYHLLPDGVWYVGGPSPFLTKPLKVQCLVPYRSRKKSYLKRSYHYSERDTAHPYVFSAFVWYGLFFGDVSPFRPGRRSWSPSPSSGSSPHSSGCCTSRHKSCPAGPWSAAPAQPVQTSEAPPPCRSHCSTKRSKHTEIKYI